MALGFFDLDFGDQKPVSTDDSMDFWEFKLFVPLSSKGLYARTKA